MVVWSLLVPFRRGEFWKAIKSEGFEMSHSRPPEVRIRWQVPATSGCTSQIWKCRRQCWFLLKVRAENEAQQQNRLEGAGIGAGNSQKGKSKSKWAKLDGHPKPCSQVQKCFVGSAHCTWRRQGNTPRRRSAQKETKKEKLQHFHVGSPPQKPSCLLPADQQGGVGNTVSLHTLSLRQFVNRSSLLIPNYS